MILLLNLLLLNFNLIFEQEVKNYHDFIEKGDSCFAAENYQCAIQFYSSFDADSVKFDSEEERLKYHLSFSDALYITGEYPVALKNFELLKSIALENQDQFYQGKAQIGIAHSLWRMTDNVRSIEEILEGIQIFEKLQDTSHLIAASNILAGIFVSIKKYDDARATYEKMLEYAIQSNDSIYIASNFEYLGIVDCFQGKYRDAITNYEKSLAINEKGDNTFRLSITLGNLAEPKMELGQYQEALQLLYRAVKIQEKHQYKSVLIYTYYTLGQIHTLTQSYDSGLYYYNKSLLMMEETSETREKEKVYKLTAENYAAQGSYKKAYKYHQLHSAEKDSLIVSERTRQLEEINARYEVERKNRENEDLISQNTKKQKELTAQKDLIQLQYTIGILIIIFLVISLFLAIRLYKASQTLITANNSKDKLFGIIAHDLKGPIGNIGAMINLLQIETDENRKSKYFKYLTQSIQNISVLTNQLLSWTFSKKGDFVFNIKQIAVRTIFERTIEVFDYQLAEKDIKVVNEIDEDFAVLADENALLTIFRNLISNAIKFTRKGGEIDLEANKAGNFIEIRISDSGVGMSQTAIQKVLEGKHVVSSTGTANEHGSGLGFSIVIEFVKKMNGKIDIHSDGKSGTSVILKLRKA
ncbi:ATP-binding protein [Marivirga harenae]|uniref:ATP-binding protein n=1 Tax=Marivirga harenae TaxID=2010992 RepID=UPI0026E0F005|nr:tetratricopeptide repeat-containing sensor histidine kinase [Marivirga harenae]WKV13889.1 tetratricopeptide repeat-containing sensor histidine kinase [Marivirga harenae]